MSAAAVPVSFVIDTDSSNEQQLFVDIPGLCSIGIKREQDGVVVDIYREGGEGNAVGTATGWNEDLLDDADEEPAQAAT